MRNKFTPGPWQFYEDDDDLGVYMTDADGSCGPQVAQVLMENLELEYLAEVMPETWSNQLSQARGDGRLIAAAPDLLQILATIVEDCGYGGGGAKLCEQFLMRAKAAITKAEGEPV